jgi:hypothetical protein
MSSFQNKPFAASAQAYLPNRTFCDARPPIPWPPPPRGTRVVKLSDDRWRLVSAAGETISEHANAELAWKALDRLEGRRRWRRTSP